MGGWGNGAGCQFDKHLVPLQFTFMGLDAVDLIIRFEAEFRIDIPDAVAATLVTPRKVIDFICQEHEDLTREQIAAQVQAIVIDQTGIRVMAYGEDKRFMEDFEMD